MRIIRKKKNVRIEMLALMDVVFLLLVFFIYAMMIMTVHRGLKISLPVSGTAEKEMVIALSLTIKTDGSLYLDNDSITLEQLTPTLQAKLEEKKEDQDISLQVFGEDNLQYQELFKVLDAIKLSGVKRISLQAKTGQVK